MIPTVRTLPTVSAALVALAVSASLSGCGEPSAPSLEGQVLDAWGTPIAGATVLVEGGNVRPLTDSDGIFTLPLTPGRFKLKAGKEGYIQEHLELEITAGAEPPRPILKLYPKPEENGFYLVGAHAYHRILPEPVHWLGNEIANVQGLKSVGEVASDPEVDIVFHTDLREDEIARLGLELRSLDFVPTKVLPGPVGDTQVTLNLYTASKPVSFELEPLRSKTDFLLTAQGLGEGAYAFHMNRLLDARDYDSFARNPEALRVVFPFRVE